MTRSIFSLLLVGLASATGLIVLSFADEPAQKGISRPAAPAAVSKATASPAEGDPTVISAFSDERLRTSDAVQVSLWGLRDAEVHAIKGDRKHTLPTRLYLPADPTRDIAAKFKLTRIPGHEKLLLFASLKFALQTPAAAKFLATNAISLEIVENDVKLASRAGLTKFIFLPHRRPGDKWDGHLGILTMGSGISPKQREEIQRNLESRGRVAGGIATCGIRNRRSARRRKHRT